MNTVLFYRPRRCWRSWLAFACAAAIHVTAVGLAKNRPELRPAATLATDVIGIDTTVDQMPPQHQDTTPPVPLSPNDEETFPQESSTPPPIQKRRATVPIARSTATGLPRFASIKALVVYGPRPEYPYVARRDRITGSGIALVSVNPATGDVLDVQMAQSTGNVFLDNSTVSALRHWRFRPGTPSRVQVPITYTLSGVSY